MSNALMGQSVSLWLEGKAVPTVKVRGLKVRSIKTRILGFSGISFSCFVGSENCSYENDRLAEWDTVVKIILKKKFFLKHYSHG